ncbi:MAG: Smr/MutS family protein [Bacteroidales bacterium]|nr:Smr/MutS family protein [Bacteroidales bacterium]
MLYPANIEQKIGFDQIRGLLKNRCLSTLGAEKVDEMVFSDKMDVVGRQLQESVEFVEIIREGAQFPDEFFFDVRDSLRRVRIEGLYMSVQELFDLRRSLDTIRGILAFLKPSEPEEPPCYPALWALAETVGVPQQLLVRINAILDKYGKVKDTASPALQAIRREQASVAGSISKILGNILRAAQNEGVVEKDVAPTLRDGRLVIPVAPAVKRRIKGIVHDESASGRTVYVEPTEVVEANNRIRELENDEHREIIRILTELSDYVRPLIPDLIHCYEFMAQMDFIRSKALFAIQTASVRPILTDDTMVDWALAVHPLLQLSLERHGKKVVPLDIELEQSRRILIISGPNAGGKSVCLKTVALLQYMLQCGMLVPMHERSRAGLFGSMFIDIGDEQSIEDDLSTYSSHLSNMKQMLRHCNGHSLILIDEFGSGTEPLIGGAIAEAVLKRLNERGTFGVITTHYQNLKHFADNHEGVVNGAMLYDRQQLQPLFQLQMGNPGSSFAVEIARKIGLPEDVIADASDIVGSEYINADKYLQDIVRDKRYWEGKRQHVRMREKELDNIIASYENEMAELGKTRKDIILQAKEEAERLIRDANACIENTIRNIRETQADKEKTRLARAELSGFKEVINDTQEQLDEKIARKMEQIKARQERKRKRPARAVTEHDPLDRPRPVEWCATPGCWVRIKGQASVGEVLEVHDKDAVVCFGNLKTTVRTNRLEPARKPDNPAIRKSTFVSVDTRDEMRQRKLNFHQDIDVRGMRGDEALQAVTYFIDDAILVGIDRVRILHGTGGGILRTLIRQYLQTVGGIRHFQDEHVEFGGAGITVVDLK